MEQFYIVDFGVNYAHQKYTNDKIKLLLSCAYDNGLDKIVCISNSYKEAVRLIALHQQFTNMHFTLGIHPHNAKSYNEQIEILIRNSITNHKFFAIGECGLDYNRMFSTKDEQIYAFKRQVELAKELNLYIYLHCRDAFEDVVAVLESVDYYKGIVHCFTGNVEQATYFVSKGMILGITGWLLDNRRNHDLVAAVKAVDINNLVVETDAPYMSVIKNQKESRSEDLYYVIEEIARLKEMTVEECGSIIYNNSLKILSR